MQARLNEFAAARVHRGGQARWGGRCVYTLWDASAAVVPLASVRRLRLTLACCMGGRPLHVWVPRRRLRALMAAAVRLDASSETATALAQYLPQGARIPRGGERGSQGGRRRHIHAAWSSARLGQAEDWLPCGVLTDCFTHDNAWQCPPRAAFGRVPRVLLWCVLQNVPSWVVGCAHVDVSWLDAAARALTHARSVHVWCTRSMQGAAALRLLRAAAYVAVNSPWTCLPRGAIIQCLEQRTAAGGSALAAWAVVRGWRVHDAATKPRRAAALLTLP